ncbi:MAG: dihydroorotase family protein [Deltaproteobacteria bacterium]|nr:dihydroorotase family protein [Deltaproteobacteria bacterium]
MNDLFIEDVRLPDGRRAGVLVTGGRIESIGPDLARPAEVPVLPGKGRLLLPGAIDAHVHFRQPGAEYKETLLSGAASAVKGGVTTCMDMPNTSPPTTTLAALQEKIRLAQDSQANLYFNFGAAPDNLDQVPAALETGRVKALKIFMGPSTGQGGLAPEFMERHISQAARLGLPVMVHAEDIDDLENEQDRWPHDVHHHHKLRPAGAELKAVAQALELAASHPVKLIICHVTQAEVCRMVEKSGIGDRVRVEASPHHLFLSTGSIKNPRENRFRVNPPLREEERRSALLAELNTGINTLGSDHAPHTLEEKEQEYDRAPSGLPGVEYLLPLALDCCSKGLISIQRLIELTSLNAAEFLGLNKGRLEAGYDADLVLVDPEHVWNIGAGDDRVASKCGWTPYEGFSITGRPEVTIVSGRIVYSID